MRAVWLEDGRLSVREFERPTPAAGEALIRVLRSGICNTDLELVNGYYPFTGILGHEFVGTVEQGPGGLVGNRVVGEINISCGVCERCQGGLARHCDARSVLGISKRHGAFADYLTLPVANLHRIADHVGDERATFTEPLAAALEIQQQIPILPHLRVLVVGAGKLGLLIARSLALTHCELCAVARRPRAVRLLAASGIEAVEVDAVPDRCFDVAVECTGNRDGLEIARRALRPRGTLVMKSTYAGEVTLEASAIVVDELQLVGSRCGPFPPALALLEQREPITADLVDATYSLEQAADAFEHAARPGSYKILFDHSSSVSSGASNSC